MSDALLGCCHRRINSRCLAHDAGGDPARACWCLQAARTAVRRRLAASGGARRMGSATLPARLRQRGRQMHRGASGTHNPSGPDGAGPSSRGLESPGLREHCGYQQRLQQRVLQTNVLARHLCMRVVSERPSALGGELLWSLPASPQSGVRLAPPCVSWQLCCGASPLRL